MELIPSLKDIIDIAIVAFVLYYIYKMMRENGSITVFMGFAVFVIIYWLTSQLKMYVLSAMLGQFLDTGVIIFVILFQEPIRRFLVEVGRHGNLSFFWRHITSKKRPSDTDSTPDWVMAIIYACMSMSKSKTGALIVIERLDSLHHYEALGDVIDANVNNRLIENIFFKNSPLHDGAMIVAHGKITSCGCVLPVSHNADVPRYLGLRHRSALGIAQETDALAIVVSEETGRISFANRGQLKTGLNATELEHVLNESLKGYNI